MAICFEPVSYTYVPLFSGSADDRKNFNELLLAIRVALNEYQEQTGDAPVGKSREVVL
jgi:hypothetical protein